MEIQNAVITSTQLGYEDHGIFTCHIFLDFGAAAQGFGGYGLDEWVEVKKERVATTGYGIEFIKAILRVAGSDSWEKLKGQHIRVEGDWGKIHRIGHILKDDWFSPNDIIPTKKNREVGDE